MADVNKNFTNEPAIHGALGSVPDVSIKFVDPTQSPRQAPAGDPRQDNALADRSYITVQAMLNNGIQDMPPVLLNAITDYTRSKSAETARGTHAAMDSFWKWLIANRDKDRSLVNTLETFGADLAQQIKPSSAAVKLSRVRSVLAKMAKNLDDLDVIDRLKLVEGPKQEIGTRSHFWLSTEQVLSLLDAPGQSTLLGIRDTAILSLMLGAGLRRSEVAGLKWGHIQQVSGHWHIKNLVGKHDKVRSFPIPSWVYRKLDCWAVEAGLPYAPADPVFWSLRRGNNLRSAGITSQAVWKVVEKHCRQANITKIHNDEFTLPRPHDLRRSFARHYAYNGGDLLELKKILGHGSVRTTELYVGAQERPDLAQPAQYLPYSV